MRLNLVRTTSGSMIDNACGHYFIFSAAGRSLLDLDQFDYGSIRVSATDEAFLARTTDEWLPELRAAGIPCGPINTVSQAFTDPHTQARGYVWECDHPTAGKIKLAGSPMHLSDTPTRLYKAPPLLGEDDEKF